MNILLVLVSIFNINTATPAKKTALTSIDLIHTKKISMPALSPDGKTLYYAATKYCMRSNKGKSHLWVTSAKKEESSKRITSVKMNSIFPSVSPNGKWLAFIGINKDGAHIWIKDLKKDSEPKPFTNKKMLPYGAMGPLVWSPNSKTILFNAAVPPQCKDFKCLKNQHAKSLKKTTKAQLFTGLMYRHWNEWRNGLVNKLFLVGFSDSKLTMVTKGPQDAPPVALGGRQDYSFDPRGREIAFTMNKEKLVAKSTNNDIWIYNLKTAKTVRLTTNKGNDFSPKYSPDGRYIAFQSMKRAGYEADKAEITLYDRRRKKFRKLATKLDRSPYMFDFAPDKKLIYFTAQDQGYVNMFKVSFKGKVSREFTKHFITDFKVLSRNKVIILNQTIKKPAELYLHKGKRVRKGKIKIRDNKLVVLTDKNELLLSDIEMNDAEEIWVKGALGDKVHTLILKPPFFKKGKKYPVIFLIHGGPQGAFGRDFHPRWNSQLFAAPGYVVVMPNFHGSTGYGMKFQDAIRGNWGSHPYKDVMAVFEAVKKLPYVNPNKIGAAGASYGGYLIDWIATKNNKFKCLVTHSGVYNLASMYGSTEELWFPEWENLGTPWNNPKMYKKWSPHNYVKNWKTPTLIVHGAKDFRVTEDQSMQLFTALQRLKVPSKFLYFPTENHFVFKPINRKLWWKTVHAWFKQYLK
jgi:dipeptidyl aminopeptidase/acylaminoacyl peptidase